MLKDENQVKGFSFDGSGSELFILKLKNYFLKICTLGLYSFKAKVKLRKFYWSHMSFQGQRFSFSGAAMDQVRGLGWITCMAILMLIFGLIAGYAIHWSAAVVCFYFGISFLLIRMKFGGFRYKMRNTVYRGIRGNVAPGAFQQYFKQALVGSFLTLITLGIYSPFNSVRLMKIKWNNASWGRQPFSFTGNGKELLLLNLKGIFLSVITLGLYLPWYIAARYRFSMMHLHFMSATFESRLSGGKIFLFTLKALFAVIFTLGIASPWMIVKGLRLFADNVSYTGTTDFSIVEADFRSQVKNSGDMAGDALDIDSDFDFAI